MAAVTYRSVSTAQEGQEYEAGLIGKRFNKLVPWRHALTQKSVGWRHAVAPGCRFTEEFWLRHSCNPSQMLRITFQWRAKIYPCMCLQARQTANLAR